MQDTGALDESLSNVWMADNTPHPRPPMRLLLINPNTTVAMTDAMVALLHHHTAGRAEIDAVTASFGHPVIASRVSYAVAAHAALEAYAGHSAPHDAVILGCFGDPGLAALREVASVRVIGLAEAAFTMAGAGGAPFAVITAGAAWGEMLRELLVLHPAGARCLGVHALDGTGLDFVGHPEARVATLDAVAKDLVASGAKRIVLGGAALAGLADRLTAKAIFIDPLVAAVEEALSGG